MDEKKGLIEQLDAQRKKTLKLQRAVTFIAFCIYVPIGLGILALIVLGIRWLILHT